MNQSGSDGFTAWKTGYSTYTYSYTWSIHANINVFNNGADEGMNLSCPVASLVNDSKMSVLAYTAVYDHSGGYSALNNTYSSIIWADAENETCIGDATQSLGFIVPATDYTETLTIGLHSGDWIQPRAAILFETNTDCASWYLRLTYGCAGSEANVDFSASLVDISVS